MFSKPLVATCGMLAWLAASAWAGTIGDPAAWIDPGGGSNPFYGTGSFSPCGDIDPITLQCTGIVHLYNATGFLLTSISLSTTINTDLSAASVSGSSIVLDGYPFECGDGTPKFFLNCNISYAPDSGDLVISFFGVYPVHQAAPGDLKGLDEGIPPLLPGCVSTPDGAGCDDVGHFSFNFLDFDLPAGSNGWTSDNTTLFPGGVTPTLDATSTDTATPEPGASTLLAAGLLSLAWLYRRNYSSRSSRS